MFTNIYKRLQESFQQSRFKVLFQNTALAKLLAQDEEPSAWGFFSTYLSSWWWNRLWFRLCVQTRDTPQFDVIIESLQILKRARPFTEGNGSAVLSALTCLQRAGILYPENFALVAAHANPYRLAEALSCLQQAGILNQENRALVAAHGNSCDLARALSWLQRDGILTQDNFALVAAHANHANLDRLASALCQAKILNSENRELVATHPVLSSLAYALSCLQKAEILNPENFAMVAAHVNPYDLAEALISLQQAGILNQENRALVANHVNPDDLASVLSCLQQAGILIQENRALVADHGNSCFLARALFWLQRDGILTQDNFALVAAHANQANLDRLASALCNLQQVKILNPENRALVAAHANPHDLAIALSSLNGGGILTQDNFALVADHVNPCYLARVLSCLQEAGILIQENRALVADHVNPCDLARALSCLQRDGVLTQDNFALVVAHVNPDDLASALSCLQQVGILTQENRALVADHVNPCDLARALSCLQQVGILTQENRALVAAHANPSSLGSAFCYLLRARILTQQSFAALVDPLHAALMTDEARDRIWASIPSHLLTTANFQRLLTAAENANPMAELQRIVNQILGVQAGAGHAAAFNPSQSTHTASVHESVSASAVRLWNRYGNSLNLEEKIIEIKAYIDGLDNTPEHQAAKCCIDRITAADYSFTDPRSQVSTRQLLALAYTAIHDKDRCSASLEDAKALFVEGLYEIQRGYNIEFGQGPEQRGDYPICLAGTFNKLMEKLNGIHTDVELVFITHEGASSKFQRLAQKYAKDYLQTQVESVNAGNHQSVQDLLERLTTAESLEPIWDAIKTQVQTQLWDEFSKAYGNNPEDARFLALIDQGQYVNCPDLTDVETALQGLLGHQASPDAGACESVAQYGLWASSQSTGACDTKDLGVNPP